MNLSLEDSPLTQVTLTKDKMDKWAEATIKGEKCDINVYGKPNEKQLKELENVRNLSKELQDNLKELETTVRLADAENQAMNPTAPILDFSEDHEFMSANQLDNCYAEEDIADAKEEEKRRLTKGKAARTEIQKFYKDQCVLVTGGTGFLGKVLIEKLLRSCGDVDTIYVLIRNKHGKNPETRLHELLNDGYLFNRAHEENPKGIYKVIPIVGDMGIPGLGISEEDRKLLTKRVTVIINCAATVRFDEKLEVATNINVRGIQEIIKLAKECRNLKAITHVSTAFSNAHLDKTVEERFYDTPISAEALQALATIDEKVLEKITPTIIGDYPNTYCFTKAIAEDAVRRLAEGMPICIVRPSMVVSTLEEPIKGWTDSVYGPVGLIVGIGTGVFRTMYVDVKKTADIIPVDLTVNCILTSAYHTAKHFKENQTSNIPIYNFVSGSQNPLTWERFIKYSEKNGLDVPTTKAVWYYGLTPTNNYYVFLLLNFFLHFLPALIIDLYCGLVGKKRQMLRFYNKVMKLTSILFYFSTKEFRFDNREVRRMYDSLSEEDRTLFNFSVWNMSWDTFFETFIVGLRVYLVKDDLTTLPEARKKWNLLFYLHQMLKTVFSTVLMLLAYYVVRSVFRVVGIC